jgi:hypothetical protein
MVIIAGPLSANKVVKSQIKKTRQMKGRLNAKMFARSNDKIIVRVTSLHLLKAAHWKKLCVYV